MADIDRDDMPRLLADLWTEKPVTAALRRGRFEAVLDFASARGMKGRRSPHRVPLSAPAVSLLQAMAAVRTDEPLVFLGQVSGVALPGVTLSRRLHGLGWPESSVHGRRSSLRDWASEHNWPDAVAEATLAHVRGDRTMQAYARSDLLEQRRQLLEAWATFVCSPPAGALPFAAAGWGLGRGR